MPTGNQTQLAVEFGNITSEAGQAIMARRAATLRTSAKADGSPVTAADTEAEEIIRRRLAPLLPGVSIIAEESFAPGEVRAGLDTFLLVDPLDGTREFISGSPEFTVNIALVERGQPVAGSVYAPAQGVVYLGGAGAYRANILPGERLAVAALTAIHTSGIRANMRATVSRSHLDPTTELFLDGLGITERVPAGSSLKFCLIAQGDAEVYPRFAPTMEWDTAAGHAVLVAAGGHVSGVDGAPLRYGKVEHGFRHDGFIARGLPAGHVNIVTASLPT